MRSYRISIYDPQLSSIITTIPFPIIESYKLTINEAGKAVFRIPRSHDLATSTNFVKGNRVKILRWSEDDEDHVPIWSGEIENVLENDRNQDLTIGCIGMLEVFKNRYTSDGLNLNGAAGTQVQGMITTLNSDYDTGITNGSTDVTNTIDLTFDRTSVFEAIKAAADEAEAEFIIDPDTDQFLFQQSIGDDISDSVVFIRNDSNPNANNVSRAELEEDGERLYNYIIGIAKDGAGGFYTSTASDATSISDHGRREKVVTFDFARSQLELDAMTQAYLDIHKDPVDKISFEPEPNRTITMPNGDTTQKGYDLYDDYNIGDIVSVIYVTDYATRQQDERIIEIDVRVDAEGNERITLKTISESQRLMEAFDQVKRFEDLDKRIAILEKDNYTS